MPSSELLEQFHAALKQQGGSAGNATLREALGWDEPTYESVRNDALAQGKVASRRDGWSDSIR